MYGNNVHVLYIIQQLVLLYKTYKSNKKKPLIFSVSHVTLTDSQNLHPQSILYRVIHDLWTLLQEMMSWVFMIGKAGINMGPILNGYGVMGVFLTYPPSCELCVTSHAMWPWHQLQQEEPVEAATCNLCCSRPSSSESCSQQWHFRKPAWSTGQCKLKEISWRSVTFKI
jgi:hypothetical protein